MLRWYVGPALIALGLALLALVGCAPRLELEGRLPRVEVVESFWPAGCVHRLGTEARCWGCRLNSYGDEVYCDELHIGPVIEWRIDSGVRNDC